MSRVLLVNPPSAVGVYEKSKIRVAITSAPFITLASLAGELLREGHEVRIIDLMVEPDPFSAFEEVLRDLRPEYVGITFTTPLFHEAAELAGIAHRILPDCTTIAGGIHASTLPGESLEDGNFDLVVIGEGERTLADICSRKDPEKINGIAFGRGDDFTVTPTRELIADLDDLPLPAWQLHDLSRYSSPHIASRQNPVGYMETNRGCNHYCTYCSQRIFGHSVRSKSSRRVVDEMFRMLELGFRDIHVKDDNFTADIQRAKDTCRLLLDEEFPAPWALPTGVNVEDVDMEFFRLARESGCYQISFGIESGVRRILKGVNKDQSAEIIRNAVEMAHEAGLETVGFFMMGLPGDTEATMKENIRFARSLPLTYAKASMTLPFPSSALYRQIDRDGRILSKDWKMYNFHSTAEVWEHENLDWDTIRRYYSMFHRKFYFRFSYIWKRFWRDIRMGQLWDDFKAVLANDWR
ncbi:MAG: radical SAM protein [Candidatus Aegiribacteria sp.]|nr:radical SAM protein [Candidatus Aegiribacteria sp.]MBD3294744.1 radical SAM protein [Candidatus Fermentibacteria bacterium]